MTKAKTIKPRTALAAQSYGYRGQRSIVLAARARPGSARSWSKNKRMVTNLTGAVPGYGRHDVGPGREVWVVVQDRTTGIFSVDSTVVDEIFAFGEVGSGALYNYWLRDYGVGHGIDMGEFYLNRNAALWAVNQKHYRLMNFQCGYRSLVLQLKELKTPENSL